MNADNSNQNMYKNKEFEKKYYNTALIKRTIHILINQFDMKSIEEFEQVYSLLNNRNDYISYLVLMVARIVKENEPEDIITMIEDSINTAYFIHLKNLIANIDHKISLTNKNENLRLMPLYQIFQQSLVKGTYLPYHSNFHAYILSSDLKWMKTNSMNSIIFPQRFMYWTPDDLIQQAIKYYCLDSVDDDSLYSIIHSQIYSFINVADPECSDGIKHAMIYYYMSLSKERLNLYEEELIQETWKPSRLFEFCLSEDEKMDFEMVE